MGEAKRMVMLLVDALRADFIRVFMEEGKLPNVSRFLEKGIMIDSVEGAHLTDVVATACLAAGVNPPTDSQASPIEDIIG